MLIRITWYAGVANGRPSREPTIFSYSSDEIDSSSERSICRYFFRSFKLLVEGVQ